MIQYSYTYYMVNGDRSFFKGDLEIGIIKANKVGGSWVGAKQVNRNLDIIKNTLCCFNFTFNFPEAIKTVTMGQVCSGRNGAENLSYHMTNRV